MANLVLGVFSDKESAEDAISDLESHGYNPKDVSIMMRDMSEGSRFAEDTGARNVVSGTLGGTATGAVVGAIAGLIASFAVPGLGVLFIGGPLVEALGLTGAAATTASGATTGALAGGLIGALMSAFGLPREDARIYEQRINEGGVLVAVPTRAGDKNEVRSIMNEFDADNVKEIETSERAAYTSAYYNEMRQKKPDGAKEADK